MRPESATLTSTPTQTTFLVSQVIPPPRPRTDGRDAPGPYLPSLATPASLPASVGAAGSAGRPPSPTGPQTQLRTPRPRDLRPAGQVWARSAGTSRPAGTPAGRRRHAGPCCCGRSGCRRWRPGTRVGSGGRSSSPSRDRSRGCCCRPERIGRAVSAQKQLQAVERIPGIWRNKQKWNNFSKFTNSRNLSQQNLLVQSVVNL